MTLSAPARAAFRALEDLTNSSDARATDTPGWDLAEVQVAARHYPGGDQITVGTLNSLRRDRLVAGPAGRYSITEYGDARRREGL